MQTVEYGDIGVAIKAADRIQAGTRGPVGGLSGGNPVPNEFVPEAPLGAPQSDRFPLRVWEGELVEGVDGLLVVPSIWERDRVRTSFNTYRGSWLTVPADRTLMFVAPQLPIPGIAAFESTVSPGLPTLITLTDLAAQLIDRPLG